VQRQLVTLTSPHRRGLRRRCQPHPQPAHQPRPPRRARHVCARPRPPRPSSPGAPPRSLALSPRPPAGHRLVASHSGGLRAPRRRQRSPAGSGRRCRIAAWPSLAR